MTVNSDLRQAKRPVSGLLVSLAALGLSGYVGGKLAYPYGVRVADESAQAEGCLTRHRP